MLDFIPKILQTFKKWYYLKFDMHFWYIKYFGINHFQEIIFICVYLSSSKFNFDDFSLVFILSKNDIIWILISVLDILNIFESTTSWKLFSFLYDYCKSTFKFEDFSLVFICWISFPRYYKLSKNDTIWILIFILDILSILELITTWKSFSFVCIYWRSKFKFDDFFFYL